MAVVSVTINGYPHNVGCEDGQEAHLRTMAGEVDRRVQYLKTLGGQGAETDLLVMAALMLADEVHDLRLEMDQMRMSNTSSRNADTRLGRRLDKIAARAEEIADKLEHP